MNKKVTIDFTEVLLIAILCLAAIGIVWAAIDITVEFVHDIQLHGSLWNYFVYLFSEV